MPKGTVAQARRPRADDRWLVDLQMGLFGGQAFLVAFELGLFPMLASSPLGIAAVAQRAGLDPRSAEALLLLCASLGLLERRDERFALTQRAEDYLLPESPTYLGDFIQAAMIAQPELTSLPFIRRAVLESRSQIYGGQKLFEAHEEQQEKARAFTRAMHGHSIGSALTWPDRLDLADVRHMVDVGGGSGAHAIGAALRWPSLSCTVLEMPVVCEVARETVARYGLSERIAVSPGDLWSDPLPAGDLHFYGDIFHDWPTERCRDLARKSFEALAPGGRIMIHEVLYDDDKTGPFAAAALTVVMLAWTEGVQRSARELGEILTSAGFGEVSTSPAFGYWSIVSARKPR